MGEHRESESEVAASVGEREALARDGEGLAVVDGEAIGDIRVVALYFEIEDLGLAILLNLADKPPPVPVELNRAARPVVDRELPERSLGYGAAFNLRGNPPRSDKAARHR